MYVDRTEIEDAAGPATQIPELFERVGDPADAGDAWRDLWDELCHQGSVSRAGFAVLPVLADIATGRRAGDHREALNLAGAIVSGEGQLEEAGYLRARYPEAMAEMHRRTLDCLTVEPFEGDETECLRPLEVMLAFEGDAVWSVSLRSVFLDLTCPSCSAVLELDFMGSSPGIRSCDPQEGIRRLDGREPTQAGVRPAAPGQLGPLGERLHRLAVDAGQPVAAEHLTFLFGRAACPDCGGDFSVAERIEASETR